MADPIPLTPEQIQALSEAAAKANITVGQLVDKLSKSAKGLIDLNAIAGEAAIGFEHLEGFIKGFGSQLNGTTKMTDNTKLALLGVSAAAINARTSFASLNGVDYKNMNTLAGQLDQLGKSLGSGGAQATVAGQIIEKAFNKIKSSMPAGAADALAVGPNAMLKVMTNMATKADNMTRLQAGLFAAASATGDLITIQEKAGEGLKNINAVLNVHNDAMIATENATGVSAEAVQNFYMNLGRVPGALQSVVNSGTAAGENINMLTAVMKMAAGNGLETSVVTKDMSDAFRNLGIQGEPALIFANRFNDLSRNFAKSGLPIFLDDVKKGLLGATDAFKNITNAGVDAAKMTENMAADANNTISGLMKVGMTGQHAAEVYVSMQKAMSGMTVAQKAFMSQQTGGASGLLGATEIDKLMLSGDTNKIRQKLMDTLKKQTGPIMDITDVKDNASAARFERQKMLMTQGPMGAAMGIKDNMDAIRMSAMMKAEAAGGPQAKSLIEGPKGLQDAMKMGTDIQNQNRTELVEMNVNLDRISALTDVMAKGFTETHFGLGIGKGENKLSELQQRRLDQAIAGGKEGGRLAGRLATEMGTAGAMPDTSDQSRQKAMSGVKSWFEHLPDVLKAMLNPLTNGLSSVVKGDAENAQAKLQKQFNDAMSSKTTTAEEKQNARNASQAMQQGMQYLNAATLSPSGSTNQMDRITDAARNQAQRGATAQASNVADAGATPYSINKIVKGPDGMNITVNVQVDQASARANAITNQKM